MANSTTGSHASTIGSIAAGKLLAKAAGGRWGPVILILAGLVLFRKRAAAKAAHLAKANAIASDGVIRPG